MAARALMRGTVAPRLSRGLCTRSSVDAAEVSKFEQQAARWWDATGAAQGLHRMNPTRVGYIRSAIERALLLGKRSDEFAEGRSALPAPLKPLAGVGLVDVGCGGGLVTEPMARLGANVLGVDMAENAINVARSHAKRDAEMRRTDNPKYEKASVEDLVGRKERFDVVLALEIIEHVAEPTQFVSDCNKLVAPGGMLFLSTLNRTLKSYALGIVMAEQVLRWLPPGTHDWNKFMKPEELQAIIEDRTSLEHFETKGIIYNPLTARFSVGDDNSINYILSARNPVEEEKTAK